MFWKRAAGVIVAGTLLAGCNQSARTPKASATVSPTEESQEGNLEQSWRAAHPGSLVGHVNAVDPSRRELSVAGLPLDQIHMGDEVSILQNGQANSVVPARVFGKENGYVQMDYGPLQTGQRDPRDGDLAIWFSPGLTPTVQAAAAAGVAPTTQPGVAAPETAAPPVRPPETTAPPPSTVPATPPPASETAAPPATQTTTPPAPPPGKVPSDLNK